MNERDVDSVSCPFCGAPQRSYIPKDAVQVKCQYCGGVFLVRPEMNESVYRCSNHPEKLSIGLCNDCGRSFCGDCLHVYELNVRSYGATLYLCPTCLREKYVDDADRYQVLGVVFLLIATFTALFIVLFALVAAGLGIASIVYGALKKKNIKIKELTVNELPKRYTFDT